MDLGLEANKRKELREILYELASSQDILQNPHARVNFYSRLELLYKPINGNKPFRHFYSDIFSVLTQIDENPAQYGDINVLGQNLEIIRRGYKVKNKEMNGTMINITDSINKLYDHVNLDIARISYLRAGDRQVSGEAKIKDLQAQVDAMTKNVQNSKTLAENIEKKVNGQQKEYIAILGIFAAVVLTFNGGITYSASVLNNIAQASIYRTIIMSLVIGLVLVNILFGLFYYLNWIVADKDKIKPLIISNVAMIVVILATCVAWKCGLVETRNADITREGIVVNNKK